MLSIYSFIQLYTRPLYKQRLFVVHIQNYTFEEVTQMSKHMASIHVQTVVNIHDLYTCVNCQLPSHMTSIHVQAGSQLSTHMTSIHVQTWFSTRVDCQLSTHMISITRKEVTQLYTYIFVHVLIVYTYADFLAVYRHHVVHTALLL